MCRVLLSTILATLPIYYYQLYFADLLANLKSLMQVVNTTHTTTDISVPVFCFYFHLYD